MLAYYGHGCACLLFYTPMPCSGNKNVVWLSPARWMTSESGRRRAFRPKAGLIKPKASQHRSRWSSLGLEGRHHRMGSVMPPHPGGVTATFNN